MDPDKPSASAEPTNLVMVILQIITDMLVVGVTTVALLLAIILSVGAIIPLVALSPLVFLAFVVSVPMGGVYRHMLTRVYLRRKLTPMFAGAAVALCTAMVIIVISVMGGFLEMVRASAQKLTGEVAVYSDMRGFPHYDALIAELKQLDEVEAATPLIHTFGLIRLAGMPRTVEVLGIKPDSFHAVTGYRDTLQWGSEDVINYFQPQDIGYAPLVEYYKENELRDLSMGFQPPPGAHPKAVGIVLGIAVSRMNRRDEQGQYHFDGDFGAWGRELVLNVLPISQSGSVVAYGAEKARMIVVNEFRSGLHDIDQGRVYVPFDRLQEMLKMEYIKMQAIDRDTGEPVDRFDEEFARASTVMVKGAGVDLQILKEAVQRATNEFRLRHPDMPPTEVQTWKERHSVILNAVEKEKGLLTILFGFISVVAVVLVAVIFYMIVSSKTRDIGTLRALGASRSAIAAIFMGYGLAIGIVGAAIGLGVAAAIVKNLNEIQDLLYLWFGFKMWDPQVYYFERIPTQLNPIEVSAIVLIAILSSLVGSIIPALLAARLNPVEALRYE